MTRADIRFRNRSRRTGIHKRHKLTCESLEDRRLLATLTVTNVNDLGSGSLREAILLSNASIGELDTIEFDISGTGPHTIDVGSTTSTPLPSITDPVRIDGYTQTAASENTLPVGQGLNTVIQILLSGNNAGIGAHGLQVAATGGGSTIRGLAIGGFAADAIHLDGNDNLIEGNFLGTVANGTTAVANNQAIQIDGTGNTIGGVTPASRNLISGNTTNGVSITSADNVVQGNIIGLQPNGVDPLANDANGVLINGAASNLIGGTDSGAGNLISGNGTNAITIIFGPSPGNTIQGNYLGTDVTGTLDRGNGFFGVLTFESLDTLIGGTDASAGNLISGNNDDGIFLQGGSNNAMILGNRIGTNATGDAAIGNSDNGVEIDGSTGVAIGGTNAGEGNLISGNADNGVLLRNNANNTTIEGNRIGTNLAGDAAVANEDHGVRVDFASGAMIGGSANGAGNLISGNLQNGVLLVGGTNAVVQGNYIGVDITGLSALPNSTGVRSGSGTNTLIGGSTVGARNIISGNHAEGVYIIGFNSRGTRVQGNYIGLNATGDAAIPGQNNNGVRILGGVANTIGGSNPGEGNVISGNDAGGIAITDQAAEGEGNVVQGNRIGTDATGTFAIPNASIGVFTQGRFTLIGGDTPAAGNLISGNTSNGIGLNSGNNAVIENNLVGLQADGTSPLGNGRHGILLDSDSHTVRANTIAHNVQNGVAVGGGSFDPAMSIEITENVIHSNGRLAIDLGAFAVGNEGVTLNDDDDTDTGQNGLQNYPILTSVESNGTTTISGTLTSTPDSDYRIEFFANSIRGFDFVSTGATDAIPGQFGEAEVYLGSVLTSTDSNGQATFTASGLPAIDELIPYVNATATDITDTGSGPLNNTSELGPLLPLGGESTIVNKTGDAGIGTLQEALFVANNSEGFDTISFDMRPDDPRHFYYTDDGIPGQVTRDNLAVTSEADDANLPTAGAAAVDPDWPHSWFSFQPGEALPKISDWVLIDGFTQPGSSANNLPAPGSLDTVPKIEIDGFNVIGHGIELEEGAEGSRIQGLVINRFRGDGIHLRTFGGVSMSGNFIGTDISGTVAVANADHGIAMHDDRFYHIGGRTPAERNLISGNLESGILSFSAAGGIIEGNVIGMDRTASQHLSNRETAILLTGDRGSPLTTIGGTLPGSANLIAETGAGAIQILSPLFPDPFQFGNPAVVLEPCRDDFVAAFALREQFFASGDQADFVDLFLASAAFFTCAIDLTDDTLPGQANPILGNSIITTGGFAIDFAGDGPTPNDGDDPLTPEIDPDADGGPNNLQNYPVLTSAITSGATTTISGSLESHTNADFRIEFFSAPTANPTGHGGGEVFLGFIDVTTDASGQANFAFPSPAVADGHIVTSTATLVVDHDEDPLTRSLEIETSEFSANIVASAPPPTDDFGDAPASYGTLLANDGARHTFVSGFTLGVSATTEVDGQPSALANADSDNGITFFGDLPQGAPLTQLNVRVSNTAALADAYLDVWIDWNQNGQFESPAERIASQSVVDGINTIGFAVPQSALLGPTVARFRLHQATEAGLAPIGSATSGEVEDYAVTVAQETFPWRNALDPNDVDANTVVNLTDALEVVSFLRGTQGFAALPVPTRPGFQPPPFYDTNGDNVVTLADALEIVAFLRNQIDGEAESNAAVGIAADVKPSAPLPLDLPADNETSDRDQAMLAYLAEFAE